MNRLIGIEKESISGFCREQKPEPPADICFDMLGWMEGL